MIPDIRCVGPDAFETCYHIYASSVLDAPTSPYRLRQRHAWVPDRTPQAWIASRIGSGITWLAEVQGTGRGFLTLRPDGYLDLFFVAPQARGTGTASALYAKMIAWARDAELTRLTTHASHDLKPMLQTKGWQVVQHEWVMRGGVAIDRWVMEFRITSGKPAYDNHRS